jgi:hypothetical protein
MGQYSFSFFLGRKKQDINVVPCCYKALFTKENKYMIKKVYGITDKDEQVELEFKKFLMITDNDSNLTIDTTIQKHPENPDLLLHIDTGPTVQDKSQGDNCRIAVEGHRYFNVLPGANNVVFIKVVRKNSTK